ncbi:MAG: DUF4126 domain-containing protein [Ignavibacteriae bacterium]|nr:DUF4126 domain-containing protein [Ignavibacteriota bacterium]
MSSLRGGWQRPSLVQPNVAALTNLSTNHPRTSVPITSETVLSVLVGIALAAACGFRIFVPLLVMSIASSTGHLTLASGFEWIATLPALSAFGVATIVEILGYYIPWVDHLLDVIATPTAVVAGTLAMASTIVGLSPFLQWTLAIVAGGGVAGLIQAFTGITRVASTATTGGVANPLVSTAEAGSAATISLLAVLVPLLAATIVVLVAVFATRTLYRRLVRINARR